MRIGHFAILLILLITVFARYVGYCKLLRYLVTIAPYACAPPCIILFAPFSCVVEIPWRELVICEFANSVDHSCARYFSTVLYVGYLL
jgi:hypothetical protein